MKIIILSFLLFSIQVLAANPTFTIQNAVEQALDKNPDILKARESLRQTNENLSFSISKVFPTVNGLITANRLKAASSSSNPLFGGDPYNQYQTQLSLTQPLYDSSLYAGYQFSKKDEIIKQYQIAVAERTLSESVLENFYTVLLDERLLKILQNTLKVDNETLAIAERYYKIGRAQKIDVLQLKTQAALLSPKIAQADDQMRTAAAQLAALLRELDASNIHLQGALVSPTPEWVKKMVEKKQAELPEVLQARETVNQFEDSRAVQMAVYWPKLNIVGQVERSAYTKRDLLDPNYTNWSIGLQLNIPIFAGLGSIYQRSALAAQERQLEFDEMKTSDTVSVSQIQTERDLQVAQTQLESSRQAAMYGRESLQEAQKSYRLQVINYLQYQSSQQAYLDSESGYYQAKYNYIVALSKYFNAIGVPSKLLISHLDELSKQAINEE